MKKYFPIVLIISILMLLFQVGANLLIKERTTNYSINEEDNSYLIDESLFVEDGVSYYDFLVTDNEKNVYTFSTINNFNKQLEVIRGIKKYKENDLTCIYPVYKKNITGELACTKNGEQVGYSALMQVNDADLMSIVTKLKDSGYNNKILDPISTNTSYLQLSTRGIDYYKDNLLDDYLFLIWRYRGLYVLDKEKPYSNDYLKYDQYENTHSALVGNYYITADFKPDSKRVNELMIYNLTSRGKDLAVLPGLTSLSFYYNGVYEGRLYVTDPDKRAQYVIDPKSAEVKVVEDGYVMIEKGKKQLLSENEFFASEHYFSFNVDNEEIYAKYGSDSEIYKSRNFYYFKTSNGSIYKSHVKSPDKAVLLFSFPGLVDWKMKNGDIMVVIGDTVYFYNDSNGLLPIAKSSELGYNYKNICDFTRKQK